jgi:hypothetical protein
MASLPAHTATFKVSKSLTLQCCLFFLYLVWYVCRYINAFFLKEREQKSIMVSHVDKTNNNNSNSVALEWTVPTKRPQDK